MQRRVVNIPLRRALSAIAPASRSFWHLSHPRSFRMDPLFAVPLPGLPRLHMGGLFDQFDRMEGHGPRLHAHETESALQLEFEVPRYKPEEITVTVKDDILTISGKRAETSSTGQSGRVVLFQESPLTEFSRSFRIPDTFDLSKQTFQLQHGVLNITIPRATEEAVPVQPTAKESSAVEGNVPTTTSEKSQLTSVAKMRWPPTIKVNDTAETLEYVCSLPEFITKDNIKLAVNRGALEFSVGHTQNVEKKDSKGAVVYQSQQSVNYSTPLALPRGTEVGDISTKFENGVLSVKVNKHANPTQSVSVSQ